MKAFYGSATSTDSEPVSYSATFPISTRARVAVYDAAAAAPRVEEIAPAPAGEYIEALSCRVYELAKQQGGQIPYTVVREVAENLIHADFAEPVVSVLDEGRTIRFADQGPGITDKSRAVLPGFTTASSEMKGYIRGVGSGLPIVCEYLSVSGGSLEIEDNLGRGSVVTINDGSRKPAPVVADPVVIEPAVNSGTAHYFSSPSTTQQSLAYNEPDPASSGVRLGTRQKQVLALVLESGSAGPSIVSRELGVALSTAYRDLASLEEMGLIEAEGGKRTLTAEGMSFLDELMGSNSAFL